MSIANIVVEMEIMAELIKAVPRFVVSISLFKFSIKELPGSNVPFVTSTDLFVELTTIHKNGKIEMAEAIIRTI